MRELILPIILGLVLSGAVIYTSIYLSSAPGGQVYGVGEEGGDSVSPSDGLGDPSRELALQATPAVIVVVAPVERVERVVLVIDGEDYYLYSPYVVSDLGLDYDGYRVVAIDMRVGGVLEEVRVESGDKVYTWTGSVRLDSGEKVIIVAD